LRIWVCFFLGSNARLHFEQHGPAEAIWQDCANSLQLASKSDLQFLLIDRCRSGEPYKGNCRERFAPIN